MVVVRDPAELPRVIRAELKSKGITQTQLAADVGFSLKHMNQMMQGHVNISVSVLFRIMEQLDVAVAFIPQRQVEG